MAAAAIESSLQPRATHRRGQEETFTHRVGRYLPRGNMLDDAAWRERHRILQIFLLLHLPALAVFGVYMQTPFPVLGFTLAPIAFLLGLGDLAKRRGVASFFTTAGIVYCSAALVGLSRGAIEAHFHFFIIIGFIALYQDWVPFLWNIVFTVISHGVGSTFRSDLMFNHHSGEMNPWLWSLIHGVAVLAACVGMVLFWRKSEDEQEKTLSLTEELGETSRREFTSELLVNLARRNQSMLYRQLDIISQLEEHESDPDALAELFRLDHLATRIRRNAESLLVLAGDQPPRVWSRPVQLTDVVRAAIAETEDLNRVVFFVDDRLAVLGHAVTDITHLLAELIDNAVRSSPPDSRVTVRSTPDVRIPGTTVVTVEDWGVGMRPEDLRAANQTLRNPGDVDRSIAKQLGLQVVARLADRWHVDVSLTATSAPGVTAVVVLPPELFFTGQGHDTSPEGLPRVADGAGRPSVPPAVPAQAAPAALPDRPEQARREDRSGRTEPAAVIASASVPVGTATTTDRPDSPALLPAVAPSIPAPAPPPSPMSGSGHPAAAPVPVTAAVARLVTSPEAQQQVARVVEAGRPGASGDEVLDLSHRWGGWWASEDGQLAVRVLREGGSGPDPEGLSLPPEAHLVPPPLVPDTLPTAAGPGTPPPTQSLALATAGEGPAARNGSALRPGAGTEAGTWVQSTPAPPARNGSPATGAATSSTSEGPAHRENGSRTQRPRPQVQGGATADRLAEATQRRDAMRREDDGDGAATPPSGNRLRRRTPLASLAPELRRENGVPAAASAVAPANPPDAAKAREALTRYQASRRAALAEHDGERSRR